MLLNIFIPPGRGQCGRAQKKYPENCDAMRWTYSRYLRLRRDCGLDPYFRLLSLRKRRREEKRASAARKIGRPRIWTLRQAASAINSWGIARHGHFPQQDCYRDEESRPKRGWPDSFEALQQLRLGDAASDSALTNAPIQITDSGVELLSNRQ